MWFVFFFKQKTAYEMRISDWSSDVCSSDLHGCKDEREGGGCEHFEEAFHPKMNHPPAPVLHDGDVRAFAVEQAGAVEQADGDGRCRQQGQIGRASCRERVCQYV